MVALSRYRVFRPLVRDAVDMIQEFVLPTIGKATPTKATAAVAPESTTWTTKRKRRNEA
ncbi:hypothetical protein [Streptacidiphilus sp. PAMC 29251]